MEVEWVWLIFLASRNPIVNKLLHSFVILSVSEGSGLRKGLEIRMTMGKLLCREIWPHPSRVLWKISVDISKTRRHNVPDIRRLSSGTFLTTV
jgi:hypothetical protein